MKKFVFVLSFVLAMFFAKTGFASNAEPTSIADKHEVGFTLSETSHDADPAKEPIVIVVVLDDEIIIIIIEK